MTDLTEAYRFEGRTLVDRDGDKIGKIDELYEDRETGRPEWALVNTGLFGTSKSFVPLRGAQAAGEDVRVPVQKAQVKDAPTIEPDGALAEDEEHEVVLHEERPVAETEVVPKERVRISTEERTDEETVSADLRKERIETDGDPER